MRQQTLVLLTACVLALGGLLVDAGAATAQGGVTPSFGGGSLVVEGDGYRAGERVHLTVRIAGVNHDFTVVADAEGRFRLDTQLAVPPLSAVAIEATDEQGVTQATTTSVPAGGANPRGGNLPSVQPSPTIALPTQLPRTGEVAGPVHRVAAWAASGALTTMAGVALCLRPMPRRDTSEGQRATADRLSQALGAGRGTCCLGPRREAHA